jgi:hypothetical protein
MRTSGQLRTRICDSFSICVLHEKLSKKTVRIVRIAASRAKEAVTGHIAAPFQEGCLGEGLIVSDAAKAEGRPPELSRVCTRRVSPTW